MEVKMSKNVLKFILCVGIIMIITVPTGDITRLFGSGKYIMVTLKDGTSEKFEYDSFSIPWIVPRVKDEFTCEEHDFDQEEVEEILILNESWNSCDGREEWLFDVYFRDDGNNVRRPLRGFIEVTDYNIRGKLYGSGENKTISFEQIEKISYY
jgi:hypothetical protein